MPPVGTLSVFDLSPLISMETLPLGTSVAFAARIIATNASTIRVNAITPAITTPIPLILLPPLNHMPENVMKAIAKRPAVIKATPSPLSPFGT